ncbi:MAG: hypothetical protein ACLQU3_23220, partial [Limisphaerales bacterium]
MFSVLRRASPDTEFTSVLESSLGADAVLTGHEPPTTSPSPCPLPATRGENSPNEFALWPLNEASP